MEKMNQKKCINIKFSEGLGIFDNQCEYPVIDDQVDHNGPTGKVKDIQGIQAYAGRDFFVPEGKEFSFDIDECPYLSVAIKAERETKTCLFLMVHDKEPNEHKNRFVVIGKTPKGDPGIYDVIADCFTIEDDDQWHEYDLDLRKIRERDEGCPYFPDAGSISIIEFYSWTRSGEKTFHFNDLIGKPISYPPSPEGDEPLPEFQHLVRGVVRYEKGLPIQGVKVEAFDIHLRRKDRLGDSITDADGLFEIFYSVEKMKKRGQQTASLFLQVIGKKDGERIKSVLAESDIMFEAGIVEKVILRVPGGPKHTWSEYEQLMSEITPLLEDEQVSSLAEDEKHQELSYLSGKMGVDLKVLAQLAGSHKLAELTHMPPEVFFGLARKRLPFKLSALLSQSAERRRKALTSAVHELIIPGRLLEDMDSIEARFNELAAWQAIDGLDGSQLMPLRAVLGTIGLRVEQQRLFVSRFIQHKGSAPELWKALHQEPELREHIGDIQFVLQLGMLTAAHEPLIRRLCEMRGDGVNSLRDLARFNREDWLKLVSQPDDTGRVSFPAEIAGKDNEEKASNYAAVMTRMIEEAFPLESLAHSIGKDETTSAGTQAFFKNVLAMDDVFDFGRTPIDKYIEEHPGLLEGVENRVALVEELKARQRLFKLTPTHERMTPLLKAGLTSSAAIQQTGRRAFAKQFGPVMGGTMEAMKVHSQASHVVASTLNLMANAGPWFKTPTYAVPETLPRVEGMPDWETLFGTFDLCRCQHCRSVHSPAAYLAELLAYLKERKVEKLLPGNLTLPTNVRDLLYARRPDVGDIELTCENTNVALPYVDLTNEVLENAIRPFTPFSLPAQVAADLDTRTLSQAIYDAFTAENHVLAMDAFIVVVQAATMWFITDHRQLYSIQHDVLTGQPRVVALGYQTFGTESELAANPSHVNAAAYTDLQAAVHPWTLPLDLWTEETRLWLQKAGVERVELMRAFQPQQAPVDPTDRAISCETLGLTKKELELITATEAVPHQPWELWGLAQAGNPVEIPDPTNPTVTIVAALSWVETLSHVRPFLKQSGLSYEELLRLLATRLINPAGSIRIESVDTGDPATCDTHKLRITNLNTPILGRIHRFVRLWRRLGWTIRELDLAVQIFQGSVADPNMRLVPRLIEQLAVAYRLHKEFGIPLEHLLALWGGIDTRRGPRDDPAGEDSLYDKLFLNPAVLKPVDAAFTLNAARDDLANGGEIANHMPGVLGGLGITSAEVTELMAAEAPMPGLNLANLSALFRRAVLAQGMGVPIGECIRWKSLSGGDPFAAAHPEDTLEFVRAVRQIVDAGFTVNEVDYLLRHQQPPGDPLTPAVETVAQVLTELRDELQTMQDGLVIETDLNGEVTRKFLGLLKWDPAQVELVVTTLNSQPAFAAPLADLPTRTVFPPSVAPRVAWDGTRRLLTFAGVLTAPDKAVLNTVAVPAANQANYQAAIDELQLKSNTFLDAVRAFERPVFRTLLAQASMPASGLIPRRLKGNFFFDRKSGELCFSGLMLGQDHAELIQIQGTDAAFKTAVDRLQTLSQQFVPVSPNAFFNETEVTPLLAAGMVPPERFRGVLEKLVPRLRRLLGESLVKQKLSESLGTEPAVLGHLMDAGTMDLFLAPEFSESHVSLVIDATRFPVLFNTFTRLGKGMLIATKLRFTPRQMGWYFRFLPDVPLRTVKWTHAVPIQAGWLDLRALPLLQNANSVPALMTGLQRLIELCHVRDQVSGNGEVVLDEILSTARVPTLAANNAALTNEVAAILKRRVGWEETDTIALICLTGLALPLPAGFMDETAPVLLVRCHSLARRINVSAARARAWAREDAMANTGLEIKQTLRARHGDDAWRKLAAPAQDLLREKKRTALVTYLTVRPFILTTPDGSSMPAWHDANGLFAYFLIDVEMSPCWKTSRIKQALSSVQLFVQRCLLHLESGVRIDISKDDAWHDWKWMKNYRVWEANRKAFLYPENWIEPELRDDKTPFFKDFENELLQNEMTAATAENAFLRYLEKLDAVAKLELIGMYEQEAADGLQPVLHVFGRTQATPAIYYYRRRTGSGRWAPWEKVDLDIEGDHVIPIIWNRRLYLFWAIFSIKARAAIPAKDSAGPPPEKYFEIQLAWSEFKQGKWLPKRISRQRMKTSVPVNDNPDDDGRNRHVFFTSISADGLRIWPEWDNPTSSYSDLVQDPYGETLNIPHTATHATVDTFFFSGCSSDATIEGGRKIYGVFNPIGSHVNGTRFEENDPGDLVLHLPVDGTSNREEVAFKATPGSAKYQLLYPHQDYLLSGSRPFFFEDQLRAFVVQPEDTMPLRIHWEMIDMVDPGKHKVVVNHYYKQVKKAGTKTIPAGIEHMAAPATGEIVNLGDVLPVEDAKFILIKDNINIAAPYLEMERVLASEGIIPVFRRERRYRFYPFYHPYLSDFIKELNRSGVDALMTLTMQGKNQDKDNFDEDYDPTGMVHPTHPIENVDFAPTGSYSQYNWELFFHAPMMIAARLTENQRFEEARQWFHYIFDPTNASSEDAPRKFWRTRPFHDLEREDYLKQRIEQLLKPTASGTPSPQLAMQIAEWRQNPFEPYAIARLRLTAFQKSVVMKYLDCLIAWGDQLFRRDTIESINEATQLYILAADLLGERPTEIAPRAEAQVQTYNSLDPLLSSFSNRLVEIEYIIAAPSADAVLVPSGSATLPIPKIPYFCVPRNEKLMGYWDTVADRLFKIRHCMNIEGVVRQLALFEPPIDPALLVRAAAAGIDIGSVLNDLNAPLPCYRFQVMTQKASELCSEVKALGAALLSALEKRDSEALSLLRSSHEIDMLKAVREVRQQQLKEATENLAALENSKLVTEARRDFYQNIARINQNEQLNLNKLASAHEWQTKAQVAELVAAVVPMIGDFDIGASGWAGSPVVKWRWGGMNIGMAAQAVARGMNFLAFLDQYDASTASIKGGFDRRWDEWKHQENLAKLELKQVDNSIEAAKIRLMIAEKELANHDQQTSNAKDIDEMMRTKFTNRELYDWMVAQVSALYFQAYQLAYDVAKLAERAYRHELGLKESNFIQFGYWDSLKKGLLAGEQQFRDLKRMEVAYLEQNKREYEITKHISLDLLHPQALVALRQSGSCFFELPEAIFDIDNPGHYLRRIKSISLSLPCVAGPYTSVSAHLTLLGNRIRRDPQVQPQYGWQGIEDPRFAHDVGGIQSIVTSTGQQDSGVFELNFRDDRYLPFEGAGVISSWRLELPANFHQFDYNTINDAVLHVRYTARDGGETLKTAVTTKLLEALSLMQVEQGKSGLFRLFSLRYDFPDRWHQFLHSQPVNGESPKLTLELKSDLFPAYARDKTIKLKRLLLLIKTKKPINYDANDPLEFAVTRPAGGAATPLEAQGLPGELEAVAPATLDLGAGVIVTDNLAQTLWTFMPSKIPSVLQETVNTPDGSVEVVSPETVEDIGVLCRYTIE